MKRFLIAIVLSVFFPTGFASCTTDDPIGDPATGQPGHAKQPGREEDTNHLSGGTMTVKIGNAVFAVMLYDNPTAAAFKKRLPMTVRMEEQGGNEKYHNLSVNLPSDAVRPGTIRTGDLMLWGDRCIVLFYKTFSSDYAYTRIGRIGDPSGLAGIVGSGHVTVTFE